MPEFDVNDAALREAFLRDTLHAALLTLAPETPPVWGAMAAQQMVEHLAWTFEVSTGRVRVACAFPLAKQQRYKAFLYDNTPTPRGVANPEHASGLPALHHPGLPEARAALVQEVERFFEQQARDPEGRFTHPIFGDITAEEWSRTHYKHAQHHLLQFGLIR
jgi:oxepin-CoA hydrolase / 3-oxo-5,6-dehydrosuberyl-CoA semialdehyde dehydrogenase